MRKFGDKSNLKKRKWNSCERGMKMIVKHSNRKLSRREGFQKNSVK